MLTLILAFLVSQLHPVQGMIHVYGPDTGVLGVTHSERINLQKAWNIFRRNPSALNDISWTLQLLFKEIPEALWYFPGAEVELRKGSKMLAKTLLDVGNEFFSRIHDDVATEQFVTSVASYYNAENVPIAVLFLCGSSIIGDPFLKRLGTKISNETEKSFTKLVLTLTALLTGGLYNTPLGISNQEIVDICNLWQDVRKNKEFLQHLVLQFFENAPFFINLIPGVGSNKIALRSRDTRIFQNMVRDIVKSLDSFFSNLRDDEEISHMISELGTRLTSEEDGALVGSFLEEMLLILGEMKQDLRPSGLDAETERALLKVIVVLTYKLIDELKFHVQPVQQTFSLLDVKKLF